MAGECTSIHLTLPGARPRDRGPGSIDKLEVESQAATRRAPPAFAHCFIAVRANTAGMGILPAVW
jgi:hypothetical protein